MKDVAELTVKQFRIFQPGIVPFALVRTVIGTQFIRENLSFADVGIDPIGGDLAFHSGAVRFSEDAGVPTIPIASLQLNDRRIVVHVHGESRDATLVYLNLARLLSGMDSNFKIDLEPIVMTEETSCVVGLELDWGALLPGPFAAMIQQDFLPVASQPRASAIATGARVVINVAYDLSAPFFRENAVTYSAKELSIQPAPKRPASDRRFLISSPTPSHVHLELIERLERALTGSASAAPGIGPNP